MKNRFSTQTLPYDKIADWNEAAARVKKKAGLKHQVTIIIPVYNQPRLTQTCLDAIFKHTVETDFDVHTVDNNSGKNTVAMLHRLARRYDNLACTRTLRNYGFGIGCNIGALTATGEFLVFLNNDTEVLPGWLPPLLETLKKDIHTGIAGPKLLYKNGALQCGGVVFNPRSNIPYHIYEHFPADHPAVNKPRCFQAYTGACFAVRAADFYALRGFDPIYSNGMEDIDFCLRMRTRLQKKILYQPGSVIYHLKGKTPGRGKRVLQNRKIFVSRWSQEIAADDTRYYGEDGFTVKEYYSLETGTPEAFTQFRARLEPSAPVLQPL
jgi:GT2 family glycosyltransferase